MCQEPWNVETNCTNAASVKEQHYNFRTILILKVRKTATTIMKDSENQDSYWNKINEVCNSQNKFRFAFIYTRDLI